MSFPIAMMMTSDIVPVIPTPSPWSFLLASLSTWFISWWSPYYAAFNLLTFNFAWTYRITRYWFAPYTNIWGYSNWQTSLATNLQWIEQHYWTYYASGWSYTHENIVTVTAWETLNIYLEWYYRFAQINAVANSFKVYTDQDYPWAITTLYP